jgi:regulator of sigma D
MNTATDHATETVTFEAGISYFCRSLCDSDCIWHFKILRRTAKSVWVLVNGEEVRRAVKVWSGVEKFEPFGNYSMSPVVSADRRSMSLAATA